MEGWSQWGIKTQFTFWLYNPYLATMVHNYLKTKGQKMTFTQFWAECVSMFGLCIKPPRVKSATNSISSYEATMEHKTCSQKRGDLRKRELQAQMELIEEQKWEIENLKAAQATSVSPQQLVSTILQAISCLYVGNKKTITDDQNKGGKKFVGTPRPQNHLCW